MHQDSRLHVLHMQHTCHERNKVYAFLPETHRAAVYTDKG